MLVRYRVEMSHLRMEKFEGQEGVQVERFASGKLQLESDRKPCLPAQLSFQEDTKVDVTLHEGRYHQVRRMFAACSNHVTALHRPSIGEYTLDGIAEGEFRVMAVRDTEVLDSENLQQPNAPEEAAV